MIFYLTGPDTYRALQKLNELKEKFLREVDPTGLGLSTVDGATLTATTLSPIFSASPLFARRRCVIVKNLSFSKDVKLQEAVIALLTNHDRADGNLIIFFEDREPAAKQLLHTWLVKHAYHQKFPALVGRAFESWVAAEAKKKGRLIEPAALRLLTERTAGDTWAVSRALAKIDGYLELSLPISRVAVEEAIVDERAEELFPLIDAIVGGRISVAAPMLTRYLAQGESAQSLVALLETQLRTLVLLTEDPRVAIPGVHPYVVKKLTPLARRYRSETVRRIYEQLGVVDRELKSSSLDPATILLAFVAGVGQTA